MRKARFKDTKIVRVVKEVEGGRQVQEVCREHGILDATYYNWKAKYDGMEISDLVSDALMYGGAFAPSIYSMTSTAKRWQ